LGIHDSVELFEVRGSISIDLLGSKRLTGLLSFAGIAQTCRPVADDDDRLMAQLLKLTQLAEDDGMPNGHVIVAWVYSEFDAQWLALVAFKEHAAQVGFFFD